MKSRGAKLLSLDLNRGLHGLAEPDLVFEYFGLWDIDVGVDRGAWDEADDFGAVDLDVQAIGFVLDRGVNGRHSGHLIINQIH